MSALIKVGHKGAAHLALGNTPASFDAALEHSVDMIEFDVLPGLNGDLVLAHDYKDRDSRECTTLADALVQFSTERFGGVELDIDLKLPGYEREVVELVEEHGLRSRSLISSMYLDSLALIGKLPLEIRRGFSVPRLRRNYLRTPLFLPAYILLQIMRARLPRKASTIIQAGSCEAIMCHEKLVTPYLARAVHQSGGQLFAWTVDSATRIEELERIGVDGVITNDPRLFVPSKT